LRINYQTRATRNLSEIQAHYQSLGGRTLALRMVRGIRQTVTSLADNPLRAPAYELAPRLRRLVLAKGAFLVFYRVTDHVQVVYIRRAELEPLAEVEAT
jgi:plasmid stabilization system protein ParE